MPDNDRQMSVGTDLLQCLQQVLHVHARAWAPEKYSLLHPVSIGLDTAP